MGSLIIILSVLGLLEAPANSATFLSFVIGVSVGITEMAVGWLVGLHLEEPKKSGD